MSHEGSPIPPLLIVGMHRSGTSLSASLLESAGMSLGERLLESNWSNPRGHFEDLDFVDLHRAALIEVGGHPDGWAETSVARPSAAWEARARALVAERRALGRPWGFKDPRASLFLPSWLDIAPDARYVVVYRAPWEVVESLYRRGDPQFEEHPELAITSWVVYTRLLLEHLDRAPDRCLCVDVAAIAADGAGFVRAVSTFLGLPLAPPDGARYERGLLHRRTTAHRVELLQRYYPEAIALYRELQSRALPLPPATPPGEPQAPSDDERRVAAVRDWQAVGALAFERDRYRICAEARWLGNPMYEAAPPRHAVAHRLAVPGKGQLVVVSYDSDHPAAGDVRFAPGAQSPGFEVEAALLTDARVSVRVDGGPPVPVRLLLAFLPDALLDAAADDKRAPLLVMGHADGGVEAIDLRSLSSIPPTFASLDDAAAFVRAAHGLPLRDADAEAVYRALARGVADCIWSAGSGEPFTGLNVENFIAIENAGFYARGWLVPTQPLLERCRAFCPDTGELVDITGALSRMRRPDVWRAYQARLGQKAGDEFGFSVLIPMPNAFAETNQPLILGVTARGGEEVLFKSPAPKRTETFVEGAKVVLVDLNPMHESFERLMQVSVGPALRALWERDCDRRTRALTVEVSGDRPVNPSVSLVIPLYGRCDLVKFQLALFARDVAFTSGEVEILYFVDDPALIDETRQLCRDLSGVYGVPVVVTYTGDNHGFAAANNLAVGAARGRMLVLMNSDVLPKRSGWVAEALRAHAALPDCGVLGAKLLYPDESLQHGGMIYERFPFWAGLFGNNHPGKGLPYEDETSAPPRRVQAVTGALMVVSRELYRDLGGLSEEYILSDFEDSDFCLKVSAVGKRVYYLPSVELYHLERKSQPLVPDAVAWRSQLTIYNAWVQGQKWGAALSAAGG